MTARHLMSRPCASHSVRGMLLLTGQPQARTIPWEAQSQTTAGRPHTRPRWDCGTGPPAPPGSRIPWDMHCSPCADSSGSRRCTTALQSAAHFTEDPLHLLTETVPSRCSLPGSLQTSSLIAQMRAGAQVAFLYDKCLSEFECLQVVLELNRGVLSGCNQSLHLKIIGRHCWLMGLIHLGSQEHTGASKVVNQCCQACDVVDVAQQ